MTPYDIVPYLTQLRFLFALAVIGGIVLYFALIWLFIKSAIKSGVKQAITELANENIIQSPKRENLSKKCNILKDYDQ